MGGADKIIFRNPTVTDQEIELDCINFMPTLIAAAGIPSG